MVSENDKAKIRELVGIIKTRGAISNVALADQVTYSISHFNSLKPHILYLHGDKVKYENGLWRYNEE